MITATDVAARANNVVALHWAGPVDSGSQRRAALLRLYVPAQDRTRAKTYGRGVCVCEFDRIRQTCVLFGNLDMTVQSRGSCCPSLASSWHPLLSEGSGKAGCRRAPAVHCANPARQEAAQRHTGAARTTRPSLRSGFTAYAELSPGSVALLPPSPCRSLTCAPGWAKHITARLDAQTPGVRTTRFCRTQITLVVCAVGHRSRLPALQCLRADVTSVHHGSPHVS